MSPFNHQVDEATSTRLAQWKGAVDLELQDLIKQASEIRANIANAKTQFKRQYYKKKFKKIQPRVLQMVAAMQRIEAQQAEHTKATQAVEANELAPA